VLPIRRFVLFYITEERAGKPSYRLGGRLVQEQEPLTRNCSPELSSYVFFDGLFDVHLLASRMEVELGVMIAPTRGKYIKKNMHICKEFQ
jgi:hypothetical protein